MSEAVILMPHGATQTLYDAVNQRTAQRDAALANLASGRMLQGFEASDGKDEPRRDTVRRREGAG